MLDSLFGRSVTAARLRSGPFGPWLDSFAGWLAGCGYTVGTRRGYVAVAADLGRWMAQQEMPGSSVDEFVVSAYLEERCTRLRFRRAAARSFLQHLRAEGVAPLPQIAADASGLAGHCARFGEYLRRERCLCDATADSYGAVVRGFLAWRFGTEPIVLAVLEAGEVAGFLRDRARTRRPSGVEHLATALRSFLRWLFARGDTRCDLSTVALAARRTRFAGVPRYLPAADVEKLLGSCDLDTPGGRRDHAILLLLARLGLRAGEVTALELDDIRWRSGEIVVRGKGSYVDRLPLLPAVGEALALYLVRDRARTSSRRVFLRLHAPVSGLGASAVNALVHAALRRAALHPPIGGPHILRHSLATRMIRAGASMAEIAEVLRHHSPGSTEVYAKVDFEALRALARPWPTAGGEL